MGSLGDDAGEVKPVKKATNVKTADIEIQNLNSQFSSSQFSGDNIQDGNADELKMTQSMVHFDDTVLIEEDMFQSQFVDLGAETQVFDDPDCIQNLESQMKQSNIRFGDTIPFEAGASHCQVMSYGGGTQIIGDLGGETQIQDDPELGGETQIQDDPELGGETQVLDDPDIGVETQVLDGSDLRGETHVLDYIDLGGETQVLDDPDGINNLGTHLIDDCNLKCDSEGEETDRTEILSDSEGLCDGESVKSDDCLLHEANVRYSSACKQELHVTASTLADLGALESLPGSRQRGFTSVRTASLRASGLAARSRAFKDDGTPGRRDTPKIGEEVDKEYHSCGFEKPKEVRNRVGSSTVRKLFSEETLPGNKGFTNNINDAEGDADYPHIPSHDNEFAGLSYVDSQEPGEFSQSTALDFVDRFLKVSFLESDQGVDRGQILKGDSNPASNPASVVKGTQSLAKKASWRPIGGETGIYDWDDSLEDEGGGAFFSRKKEDFFDGGSRRHRSLTKPRKTKGCRLNQLSDKEKRPEILDKTRNLVQSDSRLTLKKKGKMVEAAEMRIKRNLVSDLNEQLNVGVSGEASGVFVTEKDGPDMQNVGFDTQIAAEAMEALHYAEPFPNHVASVAYQGSHRSNKGSSLNCPSDQSKDPSEKQLPQKRASHSASRIGTGKSKKSKMIGVKLSKKSPVSEKKHFNNASKQFDVELVNVKSKRAKSNDRENFATYGSERQEAGTPKRSHVDEVLKSCSNATSSGCVAVKRQCIQEKSGAFSPISQRTRRAMMLNQSKCSGNEPNNSAEMNRWVEIAVTRNKRKRSKTDVDNSKLLNARNNDSERGSIPSVEVENVKLNHHEQSYMKNAKTDGARLNVLSYPKGRRAHRKFSGQVNGSSNVDALSKLSVRQDANGKYEVGQKRSESDAQITSIDVDVKRRTRSSAHARSVELNDRIEVSPKDRCKQSDVACTTPVTCVTPVNAASPVCMGNEYFKQSCKKNIRSCLMKEINSLIATVPEPASASKVSRKRRDIAHVRALFSQHLDEDIIKHQKKILARLGASMASSISDATHFVTDEFVRTRNMLEAIASGKPVVTHLWLESCNQTGCFIDEKSYILSDAKKEKEFGFSMPVSLARACQYPLLQNRRVLITPNTKPGKETIASLVKAVQGQAVERIGRSALKEDKIPDDLLVISCEEDYATCVPFLEKGAAIYSSELLLNGIVTQKLEYERYRLFEDHVKRTRSTIWLRQDGKKFLPVPKRT